MKLLNHKDIFPPTTSCHAASIIYHKGDRVLTWFGGTAEGSCDTRIYIKVNDGEAHPLLSSDDFEDYGLQYQLPFWNPVLCTFNKELFLFFKQGKFCDSWTTFVGRLALKDSKVDIARLVMLMAGNCGPSKNRPLRVDDMLLCGASYETCYSWVSALETFDPLQMIIADTSHKMTASGRVGDKGLIQPALFKLKDGSIGMVMRSDMGTVFASRAPGLDLVDTRIPNPNSSLDVLTHSNGRMYMAFNPKPLDRLPLVLQEIVEDPSTIIRREGTALPLESYLVDVPGIDLKKSVPVVYPHAVVPRNIGLTAEASYPSLCGTPEGKIECTYTYGRRILKIATVEV